MRVFSVGVHEELTKESQEWVVLLSCSDMKLHRQRIVHEHHRIQGALVVSRFDSFMLGKCFIWVWLLTLVSIYLEVKKHRRYKQNMNRVN